MTGEWQPTPAEVFPPGEYIEDELKARGWTTRALAERMGVEDVEHEEFALDLMLAGYGMEPEFSKNIILDEQTARGLARAFGGSHQYWLEHDRIWRGSIGADAAVSTSSELTV